jgi:hypothetical protein
MPPLLPIRDLPPRRNNHRDAPKSRRQTREEMEAKKIGVQEIHGMGTDPVKDFKKCPCSPTVSATETDERDLFLSDPRGKESLMKNRNNSGVVTPLPKPRSQPQDMLFRTAQLHGGEEIPNSHGFPLPEMAKKP